MPPTQIAAGSNLTLAASTDSSGQTVTIGVTGLSNQPAFTASALGATASNRLMLAAGNNVSLGTASGAAGLTVYISGQSGGGGTGGGGNFVGGVYDGTGGQTTVASKLMLGPEGGLSFNPHTAPNGELWLDLSAPHAMYGARTPGMATWQTASDKLMLSFGPGMSVGFTTATDALWLNIDEIPGGGSIGPAGPPGPAISLLAQGTNLTLGTQGSASNAITVTMSVQGGTAAGLTQSVSLAAGANITINPAANNASGSTFSIYGPAPGVGGSGGAVSYGSLSNLTGNLSTNASGTTLAFTGPTPIISGGGDVQVQLNDSTLTVGLGGAVAGGSIEGFFNTFAGSNLLFAAGSNVLLSAGTQAGQFNLSINAINLGDGGGGVGGGAVSFVQGPNITITTTANSAGTTAGFTGATGTITSGSYWAGMSGVAGGSTAGSAGVASQRLYLYAGSNITLSQSMNPANTGAGSASVTIIGASGGGGGGGGAISFVEGPNVGITTTGNVSGTTATISAAAGGGDGGAAFSIGVQGTSTMGSTSGDTGFASQRLFLYAGQNITLSQSINQGSASIGISGRDPAYRIQGNWGGDSGPTGGASQIVINAQGGMRVIGSSVSRIFYLSLDPELYAGIATATTLAGSNFTAGGTIAGDTGRSYGRLRLYPGPGISMSGFSDTDARFGVYNLTIGASGAPGGAAFSAGVYDSANTTQRTNKLMLEGLSGIRLSAATNTDGLWVEMYGPQFWGGVGNASSTTLASRGIILSAHNGISLHTAGTASDQLWIGIENIGGGARAGEPTNAQLQSSIAELSHQLQLLQGKKGLFRK